MKSNAKSKTIILLTIGILFALLPIITVNHSFNAGNSNISTEYRDDINFDKENLKTSAVSGKIHIDNNWTAAKSAGICTGNGTYSEPYVIEDLVIDGGSWRSCIMIENSIVFFKIENCTLYNFSVGIRFQNVTNSLLIENNCSSTYVFSNGIILSDNSHNNTLSGNIINCQEFGVRLSYGKSCYGNKILGNTITVAWWYGIYLSGSHNNLVSGNTINSTRQGIGIYGNNNTVLNNTISNSAWEGIILYGCVNNYLSENKMNDCGLTIGGSFLYGELSSHHVDTTNLVDGKPIYYYVDGKSLGPDDMTNAGQVILVNCTDSLISNLNTSFGSTGISLYYSSNNNITGNVANYNKLHGIYLDNSDNNTISGNTASNFGASYFPNNYDDGIYLSYSNYNMLSGNTASNNSRTGIGLSYSNYNIVSGNTANNNGVGIGVIADDNIVLGNTVNNNTGNGITVNGDNNIISGNTISGNTVSDRKGIYLDRSDNTILYFNNFINNNKHVSCYESSTSWNSPGKIIYTYKGANYTNYLGNYWDNYTGNDANNDGIGDTPFIIDGGIDNYPLMEPIENYEIIEMLDPEISDGGVPIELIAVISVISGGAVIGIATLLLIRRKRKRIE